tara:strand:+ start:385 stop:546 length:162 start_codon:yes stop_codon:yes gene_type:complete
MFSFRCAMVNPRQQADATTLDEGIGRAEMKEELEQNFTLQPGTRRRTMIYILK